jgi:hypothetical protein
MTFAEWWRARKVTKTDKPIDIALAAWSAAKDPGFCSCMMRYPLNLNCKIHPSAGSAAIKRDVE